MRIFTRLFKQCLCNTNPATCRKGPQKLIFGKYLLVTNTVMSGVLMTIGDYGAQLIENRNKSEKKIDFSRLGRMLIVGAMHGPIHHYAYKWMDQLWPVVNLRNVSIKMLLDMVVMSPICITVFIISAGLLEGEGWHGSVEELKEKGLLIYTVEVLVWPPVQFINFYYISGTYRVACVNFATMLYNVFLAYVKHNDLEKNPNEKPE